MARIVSLSILLTLIVFLGITFFRVIAPYLLPLFLAGVAAVLCEPLFRYFCQRTRGRVRLSAAITTLAVLALFLVPLLVGTFIASVQLFILAQEAVDNRVWVDVIDSSRQTVTAFLESNFDITLDQESVRMIRADMIQGVRSSLLEVAQRTWGIAGITLGVLGRAVALLVAVVMFGIGLYYFLADGPALIAAAEKLIPVQSAYQRQMVVQFNQVVRSVVIATFLAALIQGLLTSLALWILQFGHVFIIFVVATLASLIPLAGAWLVWSPFAIWLASQGEWGSAIFLSLFGVVVIGTADNLIRTYVLQNATKLHPLLAFVSVLGGLQAMGLWGVFIGPTVACCLHALVKIFNVELQALSKDRFTGSPEKTPRPPETPAAPCAAAGMTVVDTAAASPMNQSPNPACKETGADTAAEPETAAVKSTGKPRRKRTRKDRRRR